MRKAGIFATLFMCAAAGVAGTSGAQASPGPPSAPTGWSLSGIPALNYNSDDGFGYGAILQLYNYGATGRLPYVFTIQPTVFLTTGGRRDFTVFLDAPDIGRSGWRVDAYVGHETQTATPYYGIGNATTRDKSLEVAPNEKYYRFGRQRVQFTTNLQRRLGGSNLRVLLGAGAARVTIDQVPGGTTTTLLNEGLASQQAPDGSSSYVRAGVVWDSRNREVHTTRGTWADLLVQRVAAFAGDWSFTRATLTAREYVPLSPKVTLAERVVLQNITGAAPFYELAVVQTSFKPQDGLGGANTLRGLPQDRFIGKGFALSNTEVRWRAAEFPLLGAPSSLTMSGFLDVGRVWADEITLTEAASSVHAGYGGGVRIGRGPNFVVALDIGHSKESAAPVYIGLGFLF